jgi:glycosyltransferase involved in cell wall biosynthesis
MPVKNKHLIHYVPHGPNPNIYKKLDVKDKSISKIKNMFFGNESYDFVVGFNSRNAHRKHPANLILGFKQFCDTLPPEKSSKCALIIHSDLTHEAGTDLTTVVNVVSPNYKTVIKDDRLTPDEMTAFYNTCDVVANVSSNEGFGLSIAEAIMCEVPVIATVTGGLQDQLGLVDDDGNDIKFTLDFSTNSTGKYKNHGRWCKPIWPDTFNLQGSPPTPYIMDEIVDYRKISDAIKYWYEKSKEERNECGKEGRRWAMNEGGINNKNMCDQFIKAMDFTIENFTPVKSFDIFKYEDDYNIKQLPNNSFGMEL